MDKQTKCHVCGALFWTHEEKRTDVNIALQVLGDAVDNIYDRAVIISADSDLLPVITTVERLAPEKEIGVMFPIGRTHFQLRAAAHFRLKMPERLLWSSQFAKQQQINLVDMQKLHSELIRLVRR